LELRLTLRRRMPRSTSYSPRPTPSGTPPCSRGLGRLAVGQSQEIGHATHSRQYALASLARSLGRCSKPKKRRVARAFARRRAGWLSPSPHHRHLPMRLARRPDGDPDVNFVANPNSRRNSGIPRPPTPQFPFRENLVKPPKPPLFPQLPHSILKIFLQRMSHKL